MKYKGHITEMSNQLRDLEYQLEISNLKHAEELSKERYENKLLKEQHATELSKKDNELLKKELEIFKLKYKSS